jgi:hypothetical protein
LWAFRIARRGYQSGVPKEFENRRTQKEAGGRCASVLTPGAVLPPGYRLELDPDVLVLRRPDGSTVAVFSAVWADPEDVEREAREDYRRYDEIAG